MPYFPSQVKKRIMSEINVTPFVDVILVLLVIFMVSAPMMISNIEIELPVSDVKNAPSSTSLDEIIVVTVTKNGNIYFKDRLIKITDIKNELNVDVKQKENLKIFLRGDKNTPYSVIMAALVAIQSVGLHNISLVTNLESQ